MHIGVVTQSYYPVRGGVTEHVFYLSRELEKRGHRVTIITGGTKHVDDRGLRVIRIGRTTGVHLNGATVSLVTGFGMIGQLKRIAEREAFDVVHIHSPVDPILPLVATEQLPHPLVGTFHTYRESNPFHSFVKTRFGRALARLDARIAVSESAARFARTFANLPFEIIPNGVDTERFSPDVPPMSGLKKEGITILYVGRMDPRKGAKYLFKALPYLEEKLDQYQILVVGSGWRRSVYKRYIPIGLERRVLFTGAATVEEVPRYYRSADIFCSPATGQESFGIVLLEAMSSGIPVVASDISGYRHVLQEGKQGLFAKPRDSRELAEKIVQLATDARLRQTMSVSGRDHALRFDWSLVAEEVLKVYQRVSS